METQKLTVRLPQDDLQFIKQFALEHNVVDASNARQDYADYLLEKHQ